MDNPLLIYGNAAKGSDIDQRAGGLIYGGNDAQRQWSQSRASPRAQVIISCN
jgi:hypothetical protein